jgi:hypothetical protein
MQTSPGGFPRGRPAIFRLRSRARLDPVADDIPPTRAEALICSAKGCRLPARWALRWNNPRLHDPDRRKIWLACEQHRATLAEFLDARGFLREVTPEP